MLPKMSGYFKIFKFKDKINKNNKKTMYFCINDEKLLEKYKTKIEDLESIKWNALPVYDDRYMETKIRIYGNKVYTNFVAQACQKMIWNANLLLFYWFLYTKANITVKYILTISL